MLKLSRVVARNGGRLLLTVADLATVLAPLSADWNGSHVFNEQWPSHARFHAADGVGTPVALSSHGTVAPLAQLRRAASRHHNGSRGPDQLLGVILPGAP